MIASRIGRSYQTDTNYDLWPKLAIRHANDFRLRNLSMPTAHEIERIGSMTLTSTGGIDIVPRMASRGENLEVTTTRRTL
jgi:hypothetical protein